MVAARREEDRRARNLLSIPWVIDNMRHRYRTAVVNPLWESHAGTGPSPCSRADVEGWRDDPRGSVPDSGAAPRAGRSADCGSSYEFAVADAGCSTLSSEARRFLVASSM